MLYLVATPIGNLGDITLRALETLKNADIIAAEDTRHSGNLLRHYEIHKPLVSYHEHNEAQRTAELLERLREGKNIAIITDAGCPAFPIPATACCAPASSTGSPTRSFPAPRRCSPR